MRIVVRRAQRDPAAGDAAQQAHAFELRLMKPSRAIGNLVRLRRALHRRISRQGRLPCARHGVGAADLGCLRRRLLAVAARVPHSITGGLDLVDAAAGQNARRQRLDELRAVAVTRLAVAPLDQQPVVLFLAAGREAHERPAAAQLLAVQREVELALREALVGIGLGHPVAAVPDDDGARAVLALGNHAFERRVLERMILGLHREPALARIEARPLRHGPALQHAVVLEPEVIVEPPRVVLLDDELRPAGYRSRGSARGLRRALEVALRAVLPEIGGHRRYPSPRFRRNDAPDDDEPRRSMQVVCHDARPRGAVALAAAGARSTVPRGRSARAGSVPAGCGLARRAVLAGLARADEPDLRGARAALRA